MSVVFQRDCKAIEPNEQEILRYAGCHQQDPQVMELLRQCLAQVQDSFSCRACYSEESVEIAGDHCRIGPISVESRDLARHLQGCSRAIVMASTVGIEIDRMVTRYSTISPARALMFQAIGADRVENFCNYLCQELAQEYGSRLTYRFSPGYGDLSLEAGQTQIFELLDPARRIGLTLNQSMLMSPTKSVTAIVGIME